MQLHLTESCTESGINATSEAEREYPGNGQRRYAGHGECRCRSGERE